MKSLHPFSMNSLNKKTILLVEDEAIIAASQKMSLQKYGYTVILSYSGKNAIELFNKDNSIDLILMDIDLGTGLDGPQTAIKILKKKEIPIVFVSNHTDAEIVGRTEKITSYGYVVKNSEITVLDASIKMAFKLFEANKKIKETKEKLEATLSALPDFLIEVGLDGHCYDCHSPRSELLYNPIDGIVGNKIPDILPSKVSEVIMSAIREAHEKGFSFGKQFLLKVPSGNRWFEMSISRKASSADEPHFIMLRRDITGSKLTEQALIERENMLDEAQQLSHIGNWSWDIQKDEIKWSKELYEILGIDPDFPPPNYANLNSYYTKESWKILSQAVERTINEGFPYEIEIDMVCADGQIRHTTTRGNVVKNESGLVVRLYGTVQDITERKNFENNIVDLLAEKELILKEVHHRIKNNMNTIIGLLSLQAASLDDPASMAALTDAGSRVQSMKVLYDKLYYSLGLDPIPVKSYLSSLVDEIIANFPNSKSVKVQKNFDDSVLDIKKMQPLGIIINELLTNSMKYAFEGRKNALIKISAISKENRFLLVLDDNGIGMKSPVDLERTTSFGLMLVGMLTKQLGGTILFNCKDGTNVSLEFEK